MSQPCKICTHPSRDAIDRALITGRSRPQLHRDHQISKSSLLRHWQNHLMPALLRAHEARETARVQDCIATVNNLQTRTLAALAKAEQGGDLRALLTAVREARANLELLSRLAAVVDDRPQPNPLFSPE